MWFELVKALPDPASLAGFLGNEQGLDFLITQAESDDKTNIIRTRNKAKELSEGKGIPSGSNAEQVQKNADKLLEKLNAILKDTNKKAQTTLSKKLDKILKEQDKEELSKFVGKSVKNMSSKTRKEKVSLLKNNESKIREFIEEDDEDLFYTDNTKLNLFIPIVKSDKEFEKKVDDLKQRLQEYPVTFSESGEQIDIKLEDKTSYKTTNEILDILGILKAKTDKRKVSNQNQNPSSLLIVQKKGKYTLSPLLEIFGVDEKEIETEKTVEAEEEKQYVNNVSGDEQVIGYLNFISSRTIRSKLKFIPNPVIKSATQRKAREQIFGNPTIFSISLRTIFTRPSFNLAELTVGAEEQQTEKYVSLKLRHLLESEEKIKGLNSTIVSNIRTAWKEPTPKDAPRNIKRFYNSLSSQQKTEVNKYLKGDTKRDTLVFTQKEMDFLKGLSSKRLGERKRLLNSQYNKELDPSLAILRALTKNIDSLFNETKGVFIFSSSPPENMRKNVFDEINKLLRNYKQGETELVEENIQEQLSEYNPDFVLDRSGSYTPAQMIHMLYLLDLYYARTGFSKIARKFKQGNASSDELLESIKENFTKIKDAFREQIKIKVDDILENKSEYQKGLLLSRGKKRTKGVRNIFSLLEQNDVIKEG